MEIEATTWTHHEPKTVMESPRVKLLWDQNIYTDNRISARRPDIVLINKTTRSGFIIDINCPNDTNVCRNEIHKMQKYTELKIELERIWQTHFDVVPVVIGSLGAVLTRLTKYLQMIGLDASDITHLQEIALLSSCRILRICVTQSGILLGN